MPRPMTILAVERQPGQQVSPIREQNSARGRPDGDRGRWPSSGRSLRAATPKIALPSGLSTRRSSLTIATFGWQARRPLIPSWPACSRF